MAGTPGWPIPNMDKWLPDFAYLSEDYEKTDENQSASSENAKVTASFQQIQLITVASKIPEGKRRRRRTRGEWKMSNLQDVSSAVENATSHEKPVNESIPGNENPPPSKPKYLSALANLEKRLTPKEKSDAWKKFGEVQRALNEADRENQRFLKAWPEGEIREIDSRLLNMTIMAKDGFPRKVSRAKYPDLTQLGKATALAQLWAARERDFDEEEDKLQAIIDEFKKISRSR